MSEMTPRIYFDEIVLLNFKEAQENRYCLHCAMNASVSAFHMAEAFFGYLWKKRESKGIKEDASKYRKDLLGYHEDLRERCTGFTEVQQLATAFKHVYPTKPWCEIDSAGQITISIGDEDGGEGAEESESWLSVVKNGVATINVHSVLHEVVHFWKNELEKRGM